MSWGSYFIGFFTGIGVAAFIAILIREEERMHEVMGSGKKKDKTNGKS